MFKMMSDNNFPLIIAHRGASHGAYENSMEAFQLAVDQKADMIELDIHLTKDNHFVVYHDAELKYSKQVYPIKYTTLEKIQSFRLPNDEPIPLLKDVLEKFHNSIQFNIEIKCSITREPFDDLLEDVGIDTSKTVISSFIHDVHMELKESKLEYNLAYLYIFPTFQNKSVARNDFIAAMNPFARFVKKKAVKFYHSLDKKIYPWTVDDEKTIKRLVSYHIDGIITNKPKETREIVKSLV